MRLCVCVFPFASLQTHLNPQTVSVGRGTDICLAKYRKGRDLHEQARPRQATREVCSKHFPRRGARGRLVAAQPLSVTHSLAHSALLCVAFVYACVRAHAPRVVQSIVGEQGVEAEDCAQCFSYGGQFAITGSHRQPQSAWARWNTSAGICVKTILE